MIDRDDPVQGASARIFAPRTQRPPPGDIRDPWPAGSFFCVGCEGGLFQVFPARAHERPISLAPKQSSAPISQVEISPLGVETFDDGRRLRRTQACIFLGVQLRMIFVSELSLNP